MRAQDNTKGIRPSRLRFPTWDAHSPEAELVEGAPRQRAGLRAIAEGDHPDRRLDHPGRRSSLDIFQGGHT